MSETFCPPGFGVTRTVHVVVAAAGDAISTTAVAAASRVPRSHRPVMSPTSLDAEAAASAGTTRRGAGWLSGATPGRRGGPGSAQAAGPPGGDQAEGGAAGTPGAPGPGAPNPCSVPVTLKFLSNVTVT